MDWNANIDLSQQRTSSRRSNEIKSDLPPETQITVEKNEPLDPAGHGLYAGNHTNFSNIELKQLALYTIKPFLSQVSGVSEVRIIGGKMKEYWLTLDVRKMSTLSLTARYAVNSYQGDRLRQIQRLPLRLSFFFYLTVTDATVHSLEDIQDIVVRNTGKRVIVLKDIATVNVKEAVEYTRINANGREALLIAVIKQPNANLIPISRRSHWKQRWKSSRPRCPKE